MDQAILMTSHKTSMSAYFEQWSRYRRLLRLIGLCLVGFFGSGIIVVNSDSRHIFPIVGTLTILCFIAFAAYCLKLSYFRCPRCAQRFFRGEVLHRQSGKLKCCRHCGLDLFAEV
jgi:hypothetical protein